MSYWRPTRREALVHGGLGTAGLLLAGGRGLSARSAPTASELIALAERIRTAPRASILAMAAKTLQAGANHETLLGATFLAGIHDVRPRHVGGKLHCVMMIESAFQLAEQSAPQERLLAALWNLEDFKESQARDRRDGDWTLGPPPDVSFPNEAAARRELETAMEAWDDARADRAIVGLLPFHDRESLFEILWPYCARSFGSIGHKIIFGAHVERTLRRIGWEHAQPSLRSLVHGLLYLRGGERLTETFARSEVLAPRFPAGWMKGKEDPTDAESLLQGLRTASSEAAQDLIIGAARDGLGPATAWDAIRLLASEIVLREPQLLPVHAVTEVNAMAYAFRTTKSDTTRRLLILQAAGWLPLLRDHLIGRLGLSMEGPGIERLGDTETEKLPDLDGIFRERSASAARQRLDRHPAQRDAFASRVRSAVFRGSTQSHQFKYAAALLEESRLAHPRWTSRILAPAVGYLPTAFSPDTEVFERSRAALRKVGLG